MSIEINKLQSRQWSDRYSNYEEYIFISSVELTHAGFEKILDDNKVYRLGCWQGFRKRKMRFADGKVLYKHIIKLEFGKD